MSRKHRNSLVVSLVILAVEVAVVSIFDYPYLPKLYLTLAIIQGVLFSYFVGSVVFWKLKRKKRRAQIIPIEKKQAYRKAA